MNVARLHRPNARDPGVLTGFAGALVPLDLLPRVPNRSEALRSDVARKRRLGPLGSRPTSCTLHSRRCRGVVLGCALLVLMAIGLGCSRETSRRTNGVTPPASAPDNARWLLEGTNDTRFIRVAQHLRGFDMAMVETGYRYTELYWAGQDRNWDYAKYQVEKIRTAVRNGIERRPARAKSAQMLESALPGVEEALRAKDPVRFADRFAALTATCNACHHAERVPFVHVQTPATRMSPVGPHPVPRGSP